MYYFHAADENNTNLYRVARMLNTLWYYKKPVPNTEGYFSDDEPIIFTDAARIGHNEVVVIHGRPSNQFKLDATIPKGTYYTKELDRLFFGGSIGRVADCKVTVVLNEVLNPVSSEELEDKNVVCDTLTVGGVEYVQTTLSVDGVEYKVLAEAQPAPEPEPEEPTTNDGE